LITVGLLDNWIAAEVKIRVPGVTTRPAASVGGERAERLSTRQSRLFRRRLVKKGGGQLKSGAAVCQGGDGGLLDLGDRNRPRSQEAEYNLDPARNGAITPPPTANVSRFDPEYLGNMLLREAKRAERRAKFNRSRIA
jgi:hypothetical protein